MLSGKIRPAITVGSESHQEFLPSTFQCSVQGTIHANMQNSHFPYLNLLQTVSSTLVGYGKEEVRPCLD